MTNIKASRNLTHRALGIVQLTEQTDFLNQSVDPEANEIVVEYEGDFRTVSKSLIREFKLNG